jgi:hypothetical protein
MHSRENSRDERDGLSDCSDFHTPAQPSKRRLLSSVSPVKGGKLLFLNWIFDGVKSNSLLDSPSIKPSNRKPGSNVNDVLCVQSESLVNLVQEY